MSAGAWFVLAGNSIRFTQFAAAGGG
jgi:hypothetical protein